MRTEETVNNERQIESWPEVELPKRVAATSYVLAQQLFQSNNTC